jgi:hypothetical protein
LSLLQNLQTCSGFHPASYLIDAGGYFPEIKWLGREVIQLTSLSVEIKNEWSYTSILHMPSWRAQGKFYLHETNFL